ncbi:restriction endonuclease subunit S [Neisseria meningitidis]|nr:restriction endonuclease subunit S [Neisseria meningitidis]
MATVYRKKDFTESGVPAIHYGQIYTYYGNQTDKTLSFVSPELAEKLKKVDKGDVVITNTSENIEDVGKALLYLGEEQAVTGGHATIFKPSKEIVGKFFVYFTQTEIFDKAKRKFAKGTKVIDVSATDMAKIQIPIPPLETQKKIVKILDKFTELEAELALRKRQYRYYRDFLLDFDNQIGGGIADGYQCRLKDVVWKTLGEVVNIKNGKDWKNLSSGDIPVYGSGGVMGYVDTFAYDKPSVLIPRKGSITNIFYVDFPFWNVDTIYYTEIDTSKLKPKFFYYFMRTIDLMALDTGSGRPSLTQTILNKIKIPIPPLPEQEKIVAILDKFDTLTHSISEGLPYEIALRRKQYEYYRGQLLSFPKAA